MYACNKIWTPELWGYKGFTAIVLGRCLGRRCAPGSRDNEVEVTYLDLVF